LSLESVIESFGLGLPGLSQSAEKAEEIEPQEITNDQAISNAQAIEEAQVLTTLQDVSESDTNEELVEEEAVASIIEAFKPVPRPAVTNSEPGDLDEALIARPAKADLANA
ncbi:MAG: hypothetical protein ACR2RV_20210, partial [Verrucomicrobiales bacterium]